MKKLSGLTRNQADKLLKRFGANEIKEKELTLYDRFFTSLISPISIMLAIAAILSFVTGDVFDTSFITFLLFFNIAIKIYHEYKADDSLKKLRSKLSVLVKTLRDRKWTTVTSPMLVRRDIIKLVVGDLVPADVQVLRASNLSLNESSISGESLPRARSVGDTLYCGSSIVTGEVIAKVSATGGRTYFGKTLSMVQTEHKRSQMETELLTISKFLGVIAIICAILLTGFFILQGQSLIHVLILDLSLIIAGIPVAMPAVMTLIISIGVLRLAKKGVIIRKVSSLEDLATVNLFLTDKTGTLTNNKIVVHDIIHYSGFSDDDVLRFSALASSLSKDPISNSIVQSAEFHLLKFHDFKLIKHIPADSNRKRSTAFVNFIKKNMVITVGSPQIIANLCKNKKYSKTILERDSEQAAKNGYRALAVAISYNAKEEKNLRLVGMLLLADSLRDGAANEISFLNSKGISIKMISGDHKAICKRISSNLKLIGKSIDRTNIKYMKNGLISKIFLDKVASFSEILPADKLAIVKSAKAFYKVAVTGDGANDLPALKVADVGIAVYNAVDSAKATAEIVLLTSGLYVVRDMFLESRKIYEQIYTYSVYRISESFRLIFSFFILSLVFSDFPLVPLQILLLAILNDLPIMSLAYNRVEIKKWGVSKPKTKLIFGSVLGICGLASSLSFFYLLITFTKLPLEIIQTLFFLKLTVSGHLLIFIAHTKKRWFNYLPSPIVVLSILATQTIATLIATFGFFMHPIGLGLSILVWLWAILWMQITDQAKMMVERYIN